MTQRLLSHAILAFCGFAAAPYALALGFGRIPESIVFGQALDLSVPLRLEPGESLSPGCLQAEISVGEQRLPPSAYRLDLERRGDAPETARVRIRSAVVVLEPLVALSLSVGCSGVVSRQFTVFADPPAGSVDAPAVAALAPLPAAPIEPTPTLAQPESPRVTSTDAKAGQAAPGLTRRAVAEAPRRRSPSRVAAAPLAPHSAEPAAPRLKLEEPELLLQAATLAVAAQDAALASAEQAASVAQAANSAAEARLAALEKSLQDMQAQSASQRAAMAQMRLRLEQADEQNRPMWALAALALGLAAFATWLGLRLRSLQRERAEWWPGAGAPPSAAVAAAHPVVGTAAAAPLPSPLQPPAAPTMADVAVSSSAALPDAQPDAGRDTPVRQAGRVDATQTRVLSVDELIDLEQQAEFFVVLGEEDAAIDLLMAHLRSTGGVSPLPYLKLLEIYRRRQDRESYERMRQRFNRRFNAVAPDWQTDLEHGRDLQDYPDVLAALQAAWPAPLDAMAELENLLFRKSSGGGELFELPAYRDVLTLFAVARDLHRLAGRAGAEVDVLLPLMAGQDMAATLPQSIFDRLERADDALGALVEDRPTAPIDLDLSDTAPVGATLRRSY